MNDYPKGSALLDQDKPPMLRRGVEFTKEQIARIPAMSSNVVPRSITSEDRFEAALYDLVTDILRTHRSRDPETLTEVVVASAKIESIAATLIPKIHELIGAAITALNTEL